MTWQGIASRILRILPPRTRFYWAARHFFFGQRAVYNLSHQNSRLEEVASLQFSIAVDALDNRKPAQIERILDFGSGANRYSWRLAQRFNCRVVAVDILDSYAHYYTGIKGVEYHCAQSQRLPVADQSIDLVWCFLVLGGLPDDSLPGVVREFERVLRPGGMILLVENVTKQPNAKHWSFRSVDRYCALFQHAGASQIGGFSDLSEDVAIIAVQPLPSIKAPR